MKSNKIRIICIVIIALLLAAAVGLIIWETAQNGWKFDMSKSGKGIIIIIGLLLSLARLISRDSGSKPLSIYENAYKDEIGSAFSRSDNAKYKKELLRAAALYNENQFVSALNKLEKLEKHCSTHADYSAVCFFRALCFDDSGRTNEAISAYETLLKYDPKHATALSNLGILYKKVGKSSSALECYRKAIELEPENAYAWNNLAQFHLADGEWLEVLEPARRSLEYKSNMYQADTALCVALYMLGAREESKKHFDRAVLNGANGDRIAALISSLSSHTRVPDEIYRSEIADAIGILREDTELPAMILEPTDEKVKSRLGGAPIDRDIPLDSEGNKMRLLAAIWCSEIDGIPDLPARGVLRFYAADNDLTGCDFDDPVPQKDFRVLYDEDESLFSADILPDSEKSDRFPILEPIPVKPCLTSHSVTPDDFRFDSYLDAAMKKAGIEEGLEYIDSEEYDQAYEDLSVEHLSLIGGYPSFDQYDPRDSEKYRKFDTLLLQIASLQTKEGDKIMFGDLGQCQFFIEREKLLARDFTEVMYWWDCG